MGVKTNSIQFLAYNVTAVQDKIIVWSQVTGA